jgi:hypothetical protein
MRVVRPCRRPALSSSVVRWSKRGRARFRIGPGSVDPSGAPWQSPGSLYRTLAGPATQRRHIGHCGAAKLARGRAYACLNRAPGRARYRRISRRELTRTAMQRREPTHPTRRQVHHSAPARVCGRLIDIRVVYVDPLARSIGDLVFVHGSPCLTSRVNAGHSASERLHAVKPPRSGGEALTLSLTRNSSYPARAGPGCKAPILFSHRGASRVAKVGGQNRWLCWCEHSRWCADPGQIQGADCLPPRTRPT